jgi:hypothetical protein
MQIAYNWMLYWNGRERGGGWGFRVVILIFYNYPENNIMVKSTPLLRKRIVKKRTLKFTRFQSDLYGGRLAESWRRPRGTAALTQALITACVEDLEATRKCPKSVTVQTTPPSSSFPTVLKNSQSTTSKILMFSL